MELTNEEKAKQLVREGLQMLELSLFDLALSNALLALRLDPANKNAKILKDQAIEFLGQTRGEGAQAAPGPEISASGMDDAGYDLRIQHTRPL